LCCLRSAHANLTINVQLHTLQFAQQRHNVELEESWYEKLQRWDDALEAYARKQSEDKFNVEYTLGSMRCLQALGEWERLTALSRQLWDRTEEIEVRRQIAPLAASAVLNLGKTTVLFVCSLILLSLYLFISLSFYHVSLNLFRSSFCSRAPHFYLPSLLQKN
jgi:hypothetical protein